MLHVDVEDLGKSVILHCVGRIVRGEETRILCAAVRQRDKSIVLDLSEVEAIDAAGIGALISLLAAGIYLQLRNPGAAVREVLRVTRLDTVFEISDATETASETKTSDAGYWRRAGAQTGDFAASIVGAAAQGI